MTRRAPALRALGRTGLSVSEVGLGAGPLGDLALGDAAAERAIEGRRDEVCWSPRAATEPRRYGRAGSIFPHLALKDRLSARYFRGLSYNKGGNRT